MVIASSRIILDTSFCVSLKDKRSILQKIKQRILNKFNVCISEVGYQDEWGTAGLAVVVVSPDEKYASSIINKVTDFIENSFPGLLDDWDLDIYIR